MIILNFGNLQGRGGKITLNELLSRCLIRCGRRLSGGLSFTGLVLRQYRNPPTTSFITSLVPPLVPRMTDGEILAIFLAPPVALGLLSCFCAFWQPHDTATPIPEPTSAQQRGDASDVRSDTDTSAPIFTQDGSLALPPPAMTRENGGYSLRQQLSSSTGSTLLPMYMDGSDK